MIYRCFCSVGLSAAVLYSNTIKSADYVQVQNIQLISIMDSIQDEVVFQDDNARIPQANTV